MTQPLDDVMNGILDAAWNDAFRAAMADHERLCDWIRESRLEAGDFSWQEQHAMESAAWYLLVLASDALPKDVSIPLPVKSNILKAVAKANKILKRKKDEAERKQAKSMADAKPERN